MKHTVVRLGRQVLALCFCACAAFGAATWFSHHSARALVPLGFGILIVALAARYGMAVGLFGSVLTALVFAYFLFPPLGSIQIADSSARGNVAWMLVGSIAISFLIASPPNPQRK